MPRGIGLLLAALAGAGSLAGGANAGTRSDPADALGPLDLSAISLTQDVKRVKLRLTTHEPMPGTGQLARYPSRVEADDERYLCVELRTRKLGRRLLCLGGETKRGKTRLGYSRVAQSGQTTKLRAVRARLKRLSPRRLLLSFAMADVGLQPPRIYWRVVSGWRATECRPEPPPGPLQQRPETRRQEPPPAANRCFDIAPNEGVESEPLHRIRRAGCTRDEQSVLRNGSRRRKKIALTFDDGPSAYTARVLSILNERNADGTFFVLGSQTGRRSGVLRQALRAGHELGNHSTYHSALPSKSDMRRTNAVIKAATGFRPCTFRPPYGALNGTVVANARALDMSTILWDVDTNDWMTPGSSAIYQRATSAKSGSIVLMHDGGGNRSQTVAALPGIIRKLRSRGFKLVTVTELLRERFVWREVH